MPEQPTPEQRLNDLGLEIAEPLALDSRSSCSYTH